MHRILIVEDSATLRSHLASSLGGLSSPTKIVEAENGFEALRFLPREDFDLVVTDINMPDINGLELVSFIKNNEKYAPIPLVIVSTEGSERDRDKELGLGARTNERAARTGRDSMRVLAGQAEGLRESVERFRC